MRIGILTGGGDVPGLNPCIKAVVNRVIDDGHTVVGLRRGWASLVETDPDDPDSAARTTVALDRSAVRTIDRSGGTVLHTSRTNPGRVDAAEVPPFLAALGAGTDERPGPADARTDGSQQQGPHDFTAHALRVLDHLGIDALIPVGGDDTLSYGLRLHDEGVPVVAIPKTMDNDVHGTDYCIGFSTAVTRSVQFIHQLRTSTGSHERIAVIELFGRYSGETSLISAYLAGADRAIISEVPCDVARLAQLVTEDRADNPSNYAVVTVSEGATLRGGELHLRGEADAYGHRKLGGVGQQLGEELKHLTGVGIVEQSLGYLMRSGAPDSLDLMVATNYAVMAADLATSGVRGRLVALRSGTYTDVPLGVTREGVKRVDVDALYDVAQYRPKVRQVVGKPMFLY